MVPGCAEERRRFRIEGTEVVSDWGQHRDEAVVTVRQRKNTKFVKDVLSVGCRGEQPVEVPLVDPFWEESDHPEELASTGGDFLERWGGGRLVECWGSGRFV